MRYVIFSDVHGNYSALKAMYEKTAGQGIDCYLFCGDIFGYFYQIDEVIDLLRSKNTVCVKGNHDAQYLEALRDVNLCQCLAERYGSSYFYQLQKEKLLWLEQLPLKESISDENGNILLLHGNVSDYLNGRIYPDTLITDELVDERYKFIVMGHTHYRMKREYKGITLLNPGSLGQPRDEFGFGFLIMDTSFNTIEFDAVEVDVEQLRVSVLRNEKHSKRNKTYLLGKLEMMKA